MSKKANPPPPVPTRGALALLVLGMAEGVLAVFQWSRLIKLRNGGTTVCSVSEHVNCELVWNTPFASRVHELLGMPVAALGLLWGVVATVLAGLYLTWASGGHTVRPAANGLRLMAAAGALSTGVLASVSASASALCLTCLGTYILVIAFAVIAWRGLPGPVGTRAAVDAGADRGRLRRPEHPRPRDPEGQRRRGAAAADLHGHRLDRVVPAQPAGQGSAVGGQRARAV